MKRLHWYDYLSINLFWLGLNIRNTAIGSVFMPYLVDGFVRSDIKNTALGMLNASGLIIAMLVQPAMGLLSDRSTSRFGRRRPFIFVGVLFDLVLLVAIGLSGNYWVLFIVLLFQQTSANVSHGAIQGLIPDLVPEDQRGRASAVKAIFELLPIIFVGSIISILVYQKQLGLAILVTGVGLLLTMLSTMVLVKEEPLKEKPSTPLRPLMLRVFLIIVGAVIGLAVGLLIGGILGGVAGLITLPLANTKMAWMVGISLGGMVAMAVAVVTGVWAGAYANLGEDARRNSSFTWWIVNRLLFLAAVTSIQKFAPYFLMSAFKVSIEEATKMNGQLIIVVGICTIFTALPGGWLADKFGKKRLTSLAGLVAMIGTLGLLSTTIVPNLPMVYVSGVIIGLGAGLFMTTNWALGTDLAPSNEAGRYLGISNLAGAGAGIIGTGIGGYVADQINRYQAGMGYMVLFASYLVLFALSAVSLQWVRRKD